MHKQNTSLCIGVWVGSLLLIALKKENPVETKCSILIDVGEAAAHKQCTTPNIGVRIIVTQERKIKKIIMIMGTSGFPAESLLFNALGAEKPAETKDKRACSSRCWQG